MLIKNVKNKRIPNLPLGNYLFNESKDGQGLKDPCGGWEARASSSSNLSADLKR
jgi:hypothetical protein